MTAAHATPVDYVGGALALREHLVRRHWRGSRLVGPDSGVRFNYRLGRFVKSYLRWLPWRDDHCYLQAQGYWVLANHELADRGLRRDGRDVASACCREVLRAQRADGAWDYPNREWAGRVATVEGTWAALGLLADHRRTGETSNRSGAQAWRDFLHSEIGYQSAPGGIGVNYFAARASSLVPNNSALVARFLAEAAHAGAAGAAGDADLERARQLVGFLRASQSPSGEMPYEVGLDGRSVRQHFQCFQYAAFQCLDLVAYHRLTGDGEALEVIGGLARFLRGGIAEDGRVHYDCRRGERVVVYHAAAVGAALMEASRLGVSAPSRRAEDALAWTLAQQRPDGSLPFSMGDHHRLHDVRSYPRNEAMVLHHLLLASGAR